MDTRTSISPDSARADGLRSPPSAEARNAHAVGAADGLAFPDLPRLELDQLLVQLMERAGDVLAAQGRLRGLLRANALVACDLSLPVVLRQIVAAARDLIGARYAALGVFGHDGEVEQFVHAGLDDNLVAATGDLTLTSAGFPPGEPPAGSFVSVPVRIGEEVLGNLYLTERSSGGEFTAEDEELAIALAAAAGAAIANARRFAESEQRRRWLDASAELTPLLLSGAPGQPNALFVRHAATAADADFATLTVPRGAGQGVVTSFVGTVAAGLMNQASALADSPAGRVIRTGKPALLTGEARAAVAVELGSGIGPLVIVPLAVGSQVRGALMLGRLAARPGYTVADLEMATSFAAAAAVAMELAEARADQMLLAQAEDHDRIAGDLHDHVIQELFALGMTLQGQAARSDPATAARVDGYVNTLDAVIEKVRTSIFGLQQPRQASAGLPAQVMEIIDDHTAQLGFAADLSFTGSLDPGPDETLTNDILAVTREALSNCARHARSTAVAVVVGLQDGLVTLEISDNGQGIGTPARSSGLASMRRRAERNGGTFQHITAAGGGTRLTWTARLH